MRFITSRLALDVEVHLFMAIPTSSGYACPVTPTIVLAALVFALAFGPNWVIWYEFRLPLSSSAGIHQDESCNLKKRQIGFNLSLAAESDRLKGSPAFSHNY
jgi:hypothetical protein